MERCPNCSARGTGAPTCRRCGMEHGLLLDTEQSAARLLLQAMVALAAENRDAAIAALQASLALRNDQFARHLLAFASRPPNDLIEAPPSVAQKDQALGDFREPGYQAEWSNRRLPEVDF
ncbi:hypothetical protein G3480_19270 [Thiorhodococcus mannitoliphagus]|uniref:Uncharacterized protein n=1 Tax=Thiorhodococcus mannitoliphagus TaxID=329406 RepID=A0A6P1DZH6_9GAMM|nr:hypothetical protein [Thiorhodococcus mannitoliphagus]NEX22421.1 hypothetical protein [Thiorhodococcus mannitoliphagus]